MDPVVGKVILVHGPSGSGKGTQCEILAQQLGGIHISMGDLLRSQTKTFNDIADGTLADSDDILRLLDEAIASVPIDQAVVLDGTARMPEEAKWLYNKLTSLGRKVNLVIELDIPEKETMARLLSRGHNRPDDEEASILKRLGWYHTVVQHTLGFWETKTIVTTVNGEGPREEVAARIKELVDAT